MLLTNRRHRLLFLSLAGMDVAVALPYLAILAALWRRSGETHAGQGYALLVEQPLAAFILLWAILILYMLAGDLLNRLGWRTPLRELAVAALILAGWTLAVRALLHSDRPLDDLAWLHAMLDSVFNFTRGVRGELIILLANFFLWWRVAGYSDRDLSFFGVGVSFRLGMLLALLGNGLLAHGVSQPQATAIVYLVIFFAFGLAAVALARIDQKAVGIAHSSGALLPWSQVVQLWLAIAAVLGLSGAAALLYTPATLRAALGVLGPVGRLIQWVLIQIIFVLFWLLTPLLEALARYLQGIAGEVQPQPIETPEAPPVYVGLDDVVREWSLLRYCLAAGAIALALFLIFVFFTRAQLRPRADEAEEHADEPVRFAPGSLRQGLDRLRDWLHLLTRHGAGQQLLDAISVENIYANLVRLARRRGYPRRPSQPPERFLPTLTLAFPGHDERLARITAAYLRIHYGEQPITAGELEQLRADYAAITAPPADPGEGRDDGKHDRSEGNDGEPPRAP